MTDLPFVSALVQADLPVWEQCLQAEFLQKMENGTLSEDCFKSYLVEDSCICGSTPKFLLGA